MTIMDYLQLHYIADQSTAMRYPDGSGGRDRFTLVVDLSGHGDILSAEIQHVRVDKSTVFVHAQGEVTKREPRPAPQPAPELSKATKGGRLCEIIKGLRRWERHR